MFVVCILCLNNLSSEAQTYSIQDIIKKLEYAHSSLPPLRCDYTVYQYKDNMDKFVLSKSEWAFKGDKRYWKSVDAKNNTFSYYFNGKRKTSVYSHLGTEGDEKNQIVESSTTSITGPTPLEYGYLTNTDWIKDVVNSPTKIIEVNGSQNDDRYGTIVPVNVWDKNENVNLKLYLVPLKGWLCVKLEVSDSSKKFKIINETLVVKKFGGLWLPTLCRRGSVENMNDTLKESDGIWLKVEKYKFDDIGDDLFTFTPKPGNLLKRNNDIFKISPMGTELLVPRPTSSNRGYNPIGWLYMASVTTLLVLTVGAYVKWKRNQLSKSA